MITEPTVFILGAGASRPYGHPTGKELRSLICSDLIREISPLLSRYFGNARSRGKIHTLNQIKEMLKFYKNDRGQSIDLFLARNTQFEEFGKIAIVHHILLAEQSSKFDEDLEPNKREQDWYTYLFERMTDKLISPDGYKRFADNRVSFITFNYDRSLEYFIFDTLIHSFSSLYPQAVINPQKYNNLIPFDFIHIYGAIDRLPWQSKQARPYITDFDYEVLKILKNNIRVIYDRSDEELHEAKRLIRRARRIFFLGFGYHNENLEILGIPGVIAHNPKIYGTALGSTDKEIADIKKKLTVIEKNSKHAVSENLNICIEKMNCRELLREYL